MSSAWTIAIAQTRAGIRATLVPDQTIALDDTPWTRITSDETLPTVVDQITNKFNTNLTKVTLREPTTLEEKHQARCAFATIHIQGDPSDVLDRWAETCDLLNASHHVAPEWHKTWLGLNHADETHNAPGTAWAGQIAITHTGPQLTNLHVTHWAALVEGQGVTIPIPPEISAGTDHQIITWVAFAISTRDTLFAPAPAPHVITDDVQLWQITCIKSGKTPPRQAAIQKLAEIASSTSTADTLGPHSLITTLENL